MDAISITLVAIYSLSCAGFCATIAKAKNYDLGNWGAAGFFFGIIGLLAIIGMPEKKSS